VVTPPYVRASHDPRASLRPPIAARNEHANVYVSASETYGPYMCDLTADEKVTILGTLTDITSVTARLNDQAAVIAERDWMDHAALDSLLAQMISAANAARRLVHEKTGAHT
jgi:hypothetical protein